MGSFYIHNSFLSLPLSDLRIVSMNGIIADLLFGFVLSGDEEHDGYYEALPLGYASSILSRLEGKEDGYVIMTKLGCDSEAEALRAYYSALIPSVLHISESSVYPTALSVSGDNRLRYSSLSDINADDVKSFIESCGIDTLFISSTLLSFKPVSREIVSAVIEEKDKLNKVVVDTSLSCDILLLEEVKECMETMLRSGLEVYIVGEALSIDGVRGISAMKRDEMLTHLSE